MKRGEFYYNPDEQYHDEDKLEGQEHNQHVWDVFKNEPRKVDSGSTAESKWIDSSVKALKFFTIVFVFIVVLGTSVISKGTLLFMTSQIKKNVTRPYCNKNLDTQRQYVVSLPEEERVVWMWLIIFTYFVPEIGTFVRSVRICIFKSWEYPTVREFFELFITESLPAIGSALLVLTILPEMDVIKGAMLTNAVCFIPAFIGLFSRDPKASNSYLKLILDILAIVAQASAFIVWPIVEEKPILFTLPLSVIFISFGWWENFVSEKSPINFVCNLAKSRKEFQNKKYFMYAFISLWKCILFFVTTLIILAVTEGSVGFLFNKFDDAFSSRSINITEIRPIVGESNIDFDDAVSLGLATVTITKVWTPMSVWLINIISTYMCYAFSKFACKVMIQGLGFAFPTNLSVPVLLSGLIAMCGIYSKDECAYVNAIPEYLFFNAPPLTYLNDFVSHQYSWIWLIWLLSQVWITIHTWKANNKKLSPTEHIFMRPMYDAYLIDQSVALNRKRVEEDNTVIEEEENNDSLSGTNSDNVVRIYACATMWHETKEEMSEFLKSIMRMDEDQCAHRIVRQYLQYNLRGYYEFEAHIFFDDAYVRESEDDQDPHVNSYVQDLIETVDDAASNVHQTKIKMKPPTIYPTPYGGRLVWTLPGKCKMIAHLKDKAKIRAKKRWSQVMYMYYLLGYKIMDNDELTPEVIPTITENTYLLALDGDIDFQPQAVHLLVDYMQRNRSLGAACGRIHPVGSGALAWYQIFEYAMGHWLQKATEHVIGCVLCSPGCFSLFRAKALMDNNVMAKYTTESVEARHYVQYDQGEDRWLCTLLLQMGYRVEYSAASDAYTHCPEGFNEFYNQRRRWMPSTMANILDLLFDYKHIIKINDNISRLYILYQVILMVGTVIGPGTIFLMLVGAFVAAFKLTQWVSFIWNIVPILIFVITCACCKANTQLFVAAIISGVYGLVMMAVVVGIFMQIQDDGILAPSSLFFFVLAGEFIIAAFLHPKEFYCLKYGVIYYVTVPSMYMLLVIYSVFNMNNVSWGTREVTVLPKPNKEKGVIQQETKEEKKTDRSFLFFGADDKNNAGSIELSFAGLFKCFLCTYEKNAEEKEKLANIQSSLQQITQKLDYIERIQLSPETAEPRKTVSQKRRTTTHIEGSRASKASIHPRQSSQMRNGLLDLDEEDDDSSLITPSDEVQENSWFYDGDLVRSEVAYLDKREENFWKELLRIYLHPIDDTEKKEKVAKDLKDLRDTMVTTFFMLNSLFVLVVFLLTLQKEILHVNWPFNPKTNFTYVSQNGQNEISIYKEYLELEPIGFVFLIFFALIMAVQFVAMLIHRFGTFCQIIANTDLDLDLFETELEHLTEEELLEKDPIKIFKKLIKLKGLNDDDEEDEVHVSRRNTVHTLALNKQKKNVKVNDLDKAFAIRMEKIRNGEKDVIPIPRKTLAAIDQRRITIQRRKSELPQLSQQRDIFGGNNTMHFDNPAFEEDTET